MATVFWLCSSTPYLIHLTKQTPEIRKRFATESTVNGIISSSSNSFNVVAIFLFAKCVTIVLSALCTLQRLRFCSFKSNELSGSESLSICSFGLAFSVRNRDTHRNQKRTYQTMEKVFRFRVLSGSVHYENFWKITFSQRCIRTHLRREMGATIYFRRM